MLFALELVAGLLGICEVCLPNVRSAEKNLAQPGLPRGLIAVCWLRPSVILGRIPGRLIGGSASDTVIMFGVGDQHVKCQ